MNLNVRGAVDLLVANLNLPSLISTVALPKLLLLISKEILLLMPLDVFLMNMCVVVIVLLIRREIKLKKAR